LNSADSALVLPFLNAIEASLVQSGLQVFNGVDVVGQSTFVVETSAQRAGERARVNVRLIDPDPSVPIWVQQLDFAVDSAFAAQDSVARAVRSAVTQAQMRGRG
jgi:TolB-like protein